MLLRFCCHALENDDYYYLQNPLKKLQGHFIKHKQFSKYYSHFVLRNYVTKNMLIYLTQRELNHCHGFHSLVFLWM